MKYIVFLLLFCSPASAQHPNVTIGHPRTGNALAQDAAAPPYVKVEDVEVSEVMRESMVLADQLTVCAHELRRMQSAVEALPEPPSRVVWLASGLAAGLLIGASAALVAR